jgi:group I intron endonuclease
MIKYSMKKEKLIGIYIWKNTLNKKVYIGSSDDIKKRWGQHIQTAKRGSNYKFHQAIREFGEENFKKEILELVSVNLLESREIEWIKKYNSIKEGYNVSRGYNSITFNPNLENIKKNLSEKASKRNWIYKDNIQKSVYKDEIEKYLKEGWSKGRPKFSEEHINELKEGHLGITLSNSAKNKLSLLWLNKHHTEKTKELMRNKTKGRYSKEWYIKKYGEVLGLEKYKNHHNQNSGMIGRIWINKNLTAKAIKKEEYEKYRNDGWSTGRK